RLGRLAELDLTGAGVRDHREQLGYLRITRTTKLLELAAELLAELERDDAYTEGNIEDYRREIYVSTDKPADEAAAAPTSRSTPCSNGSSCFSGMANNGASPARKLLTSSGGAALASGPDLLGYDHYLISLGGGKDSQAGRLPNLATRGLRLISIE
ncbi:hypothetical protein, partial [Nocardia sp. NPDC019302]|uniref:hypothetical protein n=1 Tax=Nocardia sp. NPDC019302 TaxID=3154592 RepID=UPI0033FA9AA5